MRKQIILKVFEKRGNGGKKIRKRTKNIGKAEMDIQFWQIDQKKRGNSSKSEITNLKKSWKCIKK